MKHLQSPSQPTKPATPLPVNASDADKHSNTQVLKLVFPVAAAACLISILVVKGHIAADLSAVPNINLSAMGSFGWVYLCIIAGLVISIIFHNTMSLIFTRKVSKSVAELSNRVDLLNKALAEQSELSSKTTTEKLADRNPAARFVTSGGAHTRSTGPVQSTTPR